MNIAIIGYGKMGRAIEHIIHTYYATTHQIVCKISKHSLPEQNIFTWADWEKQSQTAPPIHIAIEFSRPEVAFDNITRCITAGIPVVCGTTGWYEQLPNIKNLCQQYNGTLLYAANFSLSVNIIFAINRQLAAYMHRFGNEYSLQIDEIHHTQKLDTPSGTAIALAQGIIAANPDKKQWVNHESDQAHEIPVISHREPDIPGTHIISYHSLIDSITLQHIAYSREGFAKGAVIAAQWLQGKQGIFTMKDVLEQQY